MLRRPLLAAARSPLLRRAIESRPFDLLVERYVAGTTVDDVVQVAQRLALDRFVTIDHLGEEVTDPAQAAAAVPAHRDLLRHLADAGLTQRVEVSVKLSAFGLRLPRDGTAIARDAVLEVCAAAAAAGTTVTVDMEDHTTTDVTLEVVADLRTEFPWVGAVVQAQLRRTEGDCRALTGPGSRVRLCKGAYRAPAALAYQRAAEVNASFVRCLEVLMAGQGLPMVATHDPALIQHARRVAALAGRDSRGYELQMLHGIRQDAQTALAAQGEVVRVYLPYGSAWFGYFMRRLAERPANLAFFARSLLGRG